MSSKSSDQPYPIDCHHRTRTVPMKVLVLGLFRTGTLSMKTALEELGYVECYHMKTVVTNPTDCDMWQQAVDAKWNGIGKFGRAEWDKLLGHCQAVTDSPAALFGPELIAAYPEAKVILTTRRYESWYASCMSTVMKVQKNPWMVLAKYMDPQTRKWIGFMRGMMEHFHGNEFPIRAESLFHDHYAQIASLVPKERLLVYDVRDGWEPLCRFLGTPCPLTEFPRVNLSAGYHNNVERRAKRAVLESLVRIMTILCGIVTVIVFFDVIRIRGYMNI